MNINEYVSSIKKRYEQGNATEHTYRTDLEQLIRNIVTDVDVTNEAKRIECGMPDYVISRNSISIGFIEAKDVGDSDLEGNKKSGNKEQFDRYKAALYNLVFTDYLDFHFYVDGEFKIKISIAEIQNGKIIPKTQNFDRFINLIKEFCLRRGQTIKSSKRLAQLMAGKAKLLSYEIENALLEDTGSDIDSTLTKQLKAFKEILIHEITLEDFADVYAQTITYGLFAARLHDPDLNTFSREEALRLLPKSNPFLRELFIYIAGPNLDERLVWIVDNLIEIYHACDVKSLLDINSKSIRTTDPIIHFYETFLKEYNPKIKQLRGVWYTPLPVVQFIVRAVDELLIDKFDLIDGLADTSKTKIVVKTQTSHKRSKTGLKDVEKEVFKVQILDPATGTGTFLAETVRQVYNKFENKRGIWSSYVKNDLIPRINGFEIMMASYAVAHIKLDLVLTELGYKDDLNSRFNIFLTNSLEESHVESDTLLAGWLSDEANAASIVKRETPIMCVMGNPPYSVSSSNKGKWISELISTYKKDLDEKKYNLDDDYIKFIRFGEYLIVKNGAGILAFITNNSFIDGITHRKMRKHLLESFDEVFILDLHGSGATKKDEKSPDGSPDENVFDDIEQGVCINLFVKTGDKSAKALGKIYHSDLFGKRESKYQHLESTRFSDVKFQELPVEEPHYFFVPKDFNNVNEYDKGFGVDELFIQFNNSIKTDRDSLFVDIDKESLEERIRILLSGDMSDEFIKKYRVFKSSSFNILKKIEMKSFNSEYIKKILYRPFDVRYIYYDPSIISRPAPSVMNQMANDNLALLTCRQQSTFDFQHILVTDVLADMCTLSTKTKENSSFFPLYIYPGTTSSQLLLTDIKREPNLNKKIVDTIESNINLKFSPEADSKRGQTFSPVDLLDYIYAVLHSQKYRNSYKEFMKIAFPKIPYPHNADLFWKLVEIGKQLRSIHIEMKCKSSHVLVDYPMEGDNYVSKANYIDGKVEINDNQFFDGVTEDVWLFHIGGHLPAQKWLKDRTGRRLDNSDVEDYMSIIQVLSETYQLMSKIDHILY